MSFSLRALGALTLVLCLNFTAFAQFGGGGGGGFPGGGGTEPPAEPGDVQARYITAGLGVLDEKAFGDNVDIDTGALTFTQIDIDLPGNSALPVTFGRSLSRNRMSYSKQAGFGNWDILIPHIQQNYLVDIGHQTDRCTGNLGGPTVSTVTAGGSPGSGDGLIDVHRHQFWNGLQLNLGSGGSKALLKFTGSAEFSPQNPRMVTKDGWIVHCGAPTANSSGDTFIATAPNGTKYAFSHRVSHDNRNGGNGYQIAKEALYVTRIEDVHGNWVNYSYSGAKLISITANDGRQIAITWSGNNVVSASAHGRTWTYQYGAGNYLSKVTLPDSTFWTLSDTPALTDMPMTDLCTETFADITVKHPGGANARYSFQVIMNGRDNTPTPTQEDWRGSLEANCPHIGAIGMPRAFYSVAVTQKQVTIPAGGVHAWAYWYEEDGGAYTGEPPISGPILPTKRRSVIFPDGRKVATTLNRAYGNNEGNVEKIEIFASANGPLLETEATTYTVGHRPGYRLFDDYRQQSPAADRMMYTTRKIITRGSDTYTTNSTYETNPAAAAYAYGAPSSVSETSSTATGTRTANYIYKHYKTPWILGLTEKVTRNGKVFEENTYSSTTGKRLTTKAFGVLQGTFTYNGDGTLATYKDALNRTTTLSNYKRGIARNATWPDTTTSSKVVNDHGWVTSETNRRGITYGIGYDSMGRLTSINRPGSWADTSVTYSNLASGIVQTATRGNARVTTTHDGFYRPILVKQESLNGGSAPVYTKSSYDGLGRTVFTSFPSASANPTAGTNTAYDALDRVTSTAETVTPFATTTTAYLAGNKIRITDPVNAQTTTTYRAFGSPATDEAMQIVDATGTTTTMTRDIHGNILTLNQASGLNGYSVNVTRNFWYDNSLRLCRHRAPEFGDELFAYDNANQMIQSSRGETAASGCGAPSAALRTAFTYDSMGRQTLINFPSGTPDISKTYDANGNLETVNRGGILWEYAYDTLDLISQEKLSIDGYVFAFDYQRDANGFVASRSSPSGLVFEFAPNGFGQPTKLGVGATNYISNVTYHPNGSVASGTYANGQVITQSLTPRQQIYELKSSKPGSITPVHLRYAYDARSKITSINDFAQTGHDSSFTYDGRGRLVTANGFWGTGTFKYDGLDNIRQKVLGSRTINLSYNNTLNRLTQVADTSNATRNFTYDSRGNVANDGRYGFVYDASNQPVSVNISGSALPYTYDGNLKRVKHQSTQAAGGFTDIYTLYSRVSDTPLLRYFPSFDHYFDWTEDIGPLSVWFYRGNLHSYRHLDHLGTVVAQTSNNGDSIVFREDYLPFGERTIGATNHHNPSFTGHVRDGDTGLNYMQARFYDPIASRFLSTDPIGYQDQLNLYAYVANDPVNMIDPNGEQAAVLGPGVRFAVRRILNGAVRSNGELSSPMARQVELSQPVLANSPAGISPVDAFGLANQAKSDSEKGIDVITQGKEPDGKQIDNRGEGRSVSGVLGEAAEAAGVEVGKTKDGKPTVAFPNGSRATGYPESKTTDGPTIEVRTPGGKVKVKTREDGFEDG